MSEVKLLSAATNIAVVQLPDRRFPGVVIQGDTLANLVSLLGDKVDDPTDLMEEARSILLSALLHYEKTLEVAGLPLPYSRQVR